MSLSICQVSSDHFSTFYRAANSVLTLYRSPPQLFCFSVNFRPVDIILQRSRENIQNCFAVILYELTKGKFLDDMKVCIVKGSPMLRGKLFRTVRTI